MLEVRAGTGGDLIEAEDNFLGYTTSHQYVQVGENLQGVGAGGGRGRGWQGAIHPRVRFVGCSYVRRLWAEVAVAGLTLRMPVQMNVHLLAGEVHLIFLRQIRYHS